MDSSPPAPHPCLLAVAAAWPEAVAEASAAAAYERALEGLDPGAVEAAVALLSRDDRPAPAPGMLRTVVLARASAPRPASPSPGPGIGPVPSGAGPARGVPSEGARIWILLRISGALAALGMLMFFAPWVTLGGVEGREKVLTGADGGGGPVMVVSIFLAVAAVVIGRSYMRRGRPARHVCGAFVLIGALGLLSAWAAQANLSDAMRLDGWFAERGMAWIEVEIEGGLWAMLVLSCAASAVAVWGAVTTMRGSHRWEGDPGYRPPALQRWAGRVVVALLVGLVVVAGTAIAAQSRVNDERAANPDVTAFGEKGSDARRAEAGNAYVRVVRDTNSRMGVAYAALGRALASGDTAGIARSVRTHIAIATRTRERLVRTVRAPADAQPAIDRMAFALTHQIESYKALANQLERYGTVNDDAIGAVTAAETATADAAARVAAALGVSTSPL